MFSKIKQAFSKLSDKKKFLILLIPLIVSLTFLYPIGSLFNLSRLEDVAAYAANIAKNNTNGHEYLSILVESKDETKTKMVSPYNETIALYGAFRESKITFAGTVNADKTNEVRINEIESNNLSFLYSNVFSNKQYKGHWLHEYYHLELMFKGNHREEGNYSFCYLSQTQADAVLIKRGQEINDKNYENLCNSFVTVSINNNDYNFRIANIYLEQNYYYEGLKEVMGDFLVSYTKYPQGLKKQACYFMRDYEFQNIFYMNRISQMYPKGEYDVKLNAFNLNGKIDNEYLLSFYYGQKNVIKEIFGYVLIVLDVAMFIISCSALYCFGLLRENKNKLFICASSLMPYLAFKLIYYASKKALFFSTISSVTNFVCILGLLILLAVLAFKKKESTND